MTASREVGIDPKPSKGRIGYVKEAVLWSSLVLGGMTLGHVLFSKSVTAQSVAVHIAIWIIGGSIYGISIWWFEAGRKGR